MATYVESSGLRELCAGDTVVFTVGKIVCKYHVAQSYLCESTGDNDRIFTLLGIDRVAWASRAYGYLSNGGCWPEYKSGDYAAATRLVIRLFSEIDGRELCKTDVYTDVVISPTMPVPSSPVDDRRKLLLIYG